MPVFAAARRPFRCAAAAGRRVAGILKVADWQGGRTSAHLRQRIAESQSAPIFPN